MFSTPCSLALKDGITIPNCQSPWSNGQKKTKIRFRGHLYISFHFLSSFSSFVHWTERTRGFHLSFILINGYSVLCLLFCASINYAFFSCLCSFFTLYFSHCIPRRWFFGPIFLKKNFGFKFLIRFFLSIQEIIKVLHSFTQTASTLKIGNLDCRVSLWYIVWV